MTGLKENLKIVEFQKKLKISREKIREFLNRLASPEGCDFSANKMRCGGKEFVYARKILNKMRILKNQQDLLIDLCQEYGGFCDCEILMNAASYLLGEDTPW